jgi:hypothetical protein
VACWGQLTCMRITVVLAACSTFLCAADVAHAQAPARVHNGPTPAESHCRLQLVPDLTIGVLDGPEEQVFGSILSHGVAADGTLYLLDTRASRISVFDHGGRFVRHIGRRGRGPGEFESADRLATLQSRVVVHDRSLGRLVEFDTLGRHVRTGLVPFAISAQSSLSLHPEGQTILVGATGGTGPVIHVFDAELRHIRSFGDIPGAMDSITYRHLGTGTVDIDRQGGIWFAPVAAYEIRRYRLDGTLEKVITREHRFAYNPRPFVNMEDAGRDHLRVRFDQNRVFSTRVQVDGQGRIWHFVRDRPNHRMVIDLFSRDGTFLQSHVLAESGTPVSNRDRRGFFYRISSVDGIPRFHRYRASITTTTNRGGLQCSTIM